MVSRAFSCSELELSPKCVGMTAPCRSDVEFELRPDCGVVECRDDVECNNDVADWFAPHSEASACASMAGRFDSLRYSPFFIALLDGAGSSV